MTGFEQYISPELLILVPALYVLGMILKRTEFLSDRFIPLTLGIVSIFVAMFYEFSAVGMTFEAVYMSIIQGILCAGCAVYGNQIYRQHTKDE